MLDKSNKIEVTSISKSFYVDASKRSMLSRLSSIFEGREHRKLITAVDNVSFSLKRGEVLGLIGRNGAGKSTILRIVAGILVPSNGFVKTEGSIVYISGFNQVTKPRLSMRENIYFAGTILGLRNSEIKNKFDEIVEFSGLREFLDVKVFQFSSGMVARLNFSILIHCASLRPPDILLLDEAMHVGGDIDFDRKATEKMRSFITNGATVIIASHSMQDIDTYCDKVIWMDKGGVVAEGDAKDIIDRYKQSKV